MTNYLTWLDLETTGLDEHEHSILEIGIVITDPGLNIIDTFNRTIYCPEYLLSRANDFVKYMHLTSGLLTFDEDQRLTCCLSSIEQNRAQEEAVCFLKRYFTDPIVLFGNSIHFDRRFIRAQMPELEKLLHYRMVDVSSFKETLKIYYPKYSFPPKKETHRSLDDIKESIKEFNNYLDIFHLGYDIDISSYWKKAT